MNVNTFLCEEVTDATFGRQNLLASNLSDTVTAPQFPYLLHTTFFTLVGLLAGETARKIDLVLLLNGEQKFFQSIDGPSQSDKSFNIRIAWSQLEVLLECEGSMEIRVTVDGEVHSQVWTVVNGPAALRARSSGLASVLLIDANSKAANPLTHLLDETRNEIFIADQYVTQDFLRELMNGQAKRLQVKVLTQAKLYANGAAENLMSDFPNLEIRFDRLFHDRLVVRDWEEAYVFGASLKDLFHGRVSFFQRIFDRHQTAKTIALLSDCWAKALLAVPVKA